METQEKELGLWSLMSIGIGGMVGGGIFAVLGLAASLAQGSTFLAFAVAGLIALVTCYSYARLTVAFPGEGGTVEFLNRAFGTGIITGGLNVLLCLSYVVMLSLYAYAFGCYGASFFPESDQSMWRHVLSSAIIVALTVLNFFGGALVVKSENLINALKIVILLLFVVCGFFLGETTWSRLEPSHWVGPIELIAAGMIIFLNYEGFELIANASPEAANPKRDLPRAYFGSVTITLGLYVLIAIVALEHLSADALVQAQDYALAVAAESFMGRFGFVLIGVAAMLATSSAINATLFGAAKITFILAREGELPKSFQKEIWHKPVEGLLVIAVITLFAANFLDLSAIATMGSAGFLLTFTAVNWSNVRLAKQTRSSALISAFGALSCVCALAIMCWQVWQNPTTRTQLWSVIGMVVFAFVVEGIYRGLAGRTIRALSGTGEGH